MPRLIYPADRAAWLAERRQNVNSTESPALFDLSPYQTRAELFHIKSGDISDTFEENERMRVGRFLESAIAAMVAEDTGWKLRAANYYALHDRVDRMGASFDYEAVANERGPGIVEIKNVDWLVFRDGWRTEDGQVEAPPHIEIQLQHQLEVMNRSWGAIAVLVGGNDLKLIIRERDPEMGRMIASAVTDFIRDLEKGRAPAWDFERDHELIARLYGSAQGDPLDARDDAHLAELALRYQRAAADEKIARTAKDAAKAEILTIIGDAPKAITSVGLISATEVAETPATVITEAMIGQTYGGRKGYRRFQFTPKKEG